MIDQRLMIAYEAIDKGEIDLLSLDIFDTLLWRKLLLPIDLFLLLGKQFKEEGWLIDAVPADAFVELRIKAEQVARLKKQREESGKEVTLKEIYWEFHGIFNKISIEEMIQGKKGIINEADVDELVAIEVALEKQLLVRNPDIVRLMQHAHRRHIKIVLVSNTYFNETQIASFLGHETTSLVESTYLSCEEGYGKREGLLNRIVENHKIEPNRILHIGDSYLSDCVPAEKAGMQTIYYQKYDQQLAEVLQREWPGSCDARRKLIDPLQGDFGLTFLRSSLHFSTALSGMKKREAALWNYGATLLGPILVGFVHWIYTRCQQMQQSEVLCLMREGQLYAELIRQYAPYFPSHKIEAKELWVSRRFMTHAAIVYGTPQELFSTMNAHPAASFTVESFCHYLGVNLEKIPYLKKLRYMWLAEEEMRKTIATYLSEHSSIREEILHMAAKKREHFLKYFATRTNLSAEQITLVDVGWSGTIQGAMQVILKLASSSSHLHGLYLGTINETDTALMQGWIREGYLLKMGYPDLVNAVKRGFYALEQVAVGSLGPLVDIDSAGQIVTTKPVASPQQQREAQIIQTGIKACFNRVGEYVQQGIMKLDGSSEALAEQLRHLLVRSTSYPTQQEVELFSKWRHDHISGKGTGSHTFADDPYYAEVIADMLPEAALEDREIVWVGGYAAKKGRHVATQIQAILQKKMEKEWLLSSDTLPVHLFLDVGKGFSKKPTVQLNVRSNPNRCFYVYRRLISTKKTIQQIQIAVDRPHALIRIKSLHLRVRYRQKPEADQFIFFEKEKEELIHCSEKEVAPCTFLCRENPLRLTYRFNDEEAYLIDLNLSIEIFG